MKLFHEARLQTDTPRRNLYVRTFGCQMNEVDSLRVQRALAAEGYLLTADMESADVIFLNTCSVRAKADQKALSFLGRLRRLKVRHPGLKIIVAGCMGQQLGAQLLERFDHLDLVVGTRGIPLIAQLLHQIEQKGSRLAVLPEAEPDGAEELPVPDGTLERSVAASVTVMQGCNNFCTYCIVPHVRGRERSRPVDAILREIQALTAAGAREVLLLGQNVNSYGRGLAEEVSFVDLLHHIQAETNVARFRFTTSHPKDLTDRLMRCFAELPSLCKHLHLPVQSGSDRVLERMNRRYTALHYLQKIERLRSLCPDIALTSDVMVGFPGETDDDFRQTLALLREVEFDNLFSFRYSDRPPAQASDYPDKVPEAVKARRLTELQGLQAEITLRKNQAEVGCVREVLVEGASKASNGQLTGRTTQTRTVNFEGAGEHIGTLVRVKITAAFSHSLRGDLLVD